MKRINSLIDHTNLEVSASEKDIKRLCDEAMEYNFRGVCVNSLWLPFVSKYLKNTNVKIISVCDFPLGSSLTEVREREAEIIVENGAEEIDVVIQIPLLKSKKYKEIEADIEGIVDIIHPNGVLKVIIEAPILSSEEILLAAKITEDAGADFVKSGTGTNGVVSAVQIKQIKKATELPVKAAGGINNVDKALELLSSGATILGSSSGKKIMNELKKNKIERYE